LHLAPDTNSGATGFYRATKYVLPKQEIETISLTDLLAREGIDRVDLMKIDIEGAEYEAILASPSLFETYRIKALALELHPMVLAKHGKSAADIEEFLSRVGYKKTIKHGNSVWLAPGT
jgi:hypothetical protein